MKKVALPFFALFLTVLMSNLQAQDALDASGGDASGGGGSSGYSLGQVFYNTYTVSSGSVEQGVQHAYEIKDAISDLKGRDILLLAYPNPVSDFLLLHTEAEQPELFRYQLSDVNGKILMDGTITAKDFIIGTGHLTPATYFVQILQGNLWIKTFTIIKNH